MKRLIAVLLLAIGASAQTTPNIALNIPAYGTQNWNVLMNNNFSSLDLFLSGNSLLAALHITAVTAATLSLSGNLSVAGTSTFTNQVVVSSVNSTTAFQVASTQVGSTSSPPICLTDGQVSPAKNCIAKNATGLLFSNNSGGNEVQFGDATASTFFDGLIVNKHMTNGTGFQHIRNNSPCTTAASLPSTCNDTITWSPAFADTNYTVTCTGGNGGTGLPVIQSYGSKGTGSIVVVTASMTSAAAGFSSINCMAAHD